MMFSRGNGLVKRAWNFRHATVNGVPSIGVINNTLASKQGASNMYGGTQFHPIQGVRGIITKTAFINVTGQFACALTDECQVIAIRVDDGKVVYKPEGITADTLDAAKDAVNEALYPRSPVSFEPRHYMQDHYTSGGGGMRNHAMTMGQMSPRYNQPTYAVGRSAATGAAFNPYPETHAYSNDNGNPPFADPGRAAVVGTPQAQLVQRKQDYAVLAMSGVALVLAVSVAAMWCFVDPQGGLKRTDNLIAQLGTAATNQRDALDVVGKRVLSAEDLIAQLAKETTHQGKSLDAVSRRVNSVVTTAGNVRKDLDAHTTAYALKTEYYDRRLSALDAKVGNLLASAHSHTATEMLAIDQGPTGSAAAGQTPSKGLVVYGSNKEQDAPPSGNNIEVKKVAESAGGGALAKKDTISDYIASGFSWISMIIGACMISFILFLFVYEHLKILAE